MRGIFPNIFFEGKHVFKAYNLIFYMYLQPEQILTWYMIWYESVQMFKLSVKVFTIQCV